MRKIWMKKQPETTDIPPAAEEKKPAERPNPEDIQKELENMKMDDLLRSVLGEERMKRVEESSKKAKK